jgi:hypothetical protein
MLSWATSLQGESGLKYKCIKMMLRSNDIGEYKVKMSKRFSLGSPKATRSRMILGAFIGILRICKTITSDF